jgi:glycine cleavage system H protein
MGITEHAQALLGDMVFVELPSEGDEASAEDEFCVVESSTRGFRCIVYRL